jgi:hypothetical protein
VKRSFWRRVGGVLTNLWQRLSRALAAPPPSPLPPKKGRHHSDLDAPLVVPALGHVYHFIIHATFDWKADGMDSATLQRCARQWMPLAIRELHQCVAAKSRNFAPHRARALEMSVNQMLAGGAEWSFGTAVRCLPRIAVELDERVLEQVRMYSEKRIRMDCEHDEGLRRAELADQLSQRWVKVLEGLLESSVASGAARLTEQQLAEVVDGLLVTQGNITELWERILQDESLGSFERAKAHDGLRDHLNIRSFKPRAAANGHNGNSASN